MDLTYQYTKLRNTFGRQPLFCERGPEFCDSIGINKAQQKLFMLRNPVHESTQYGPTVSKHHMNTIRPVFKDASANHAEGGWPKDVNCIDFEQTQRYRRKFEKDDAYIHCVTKLSPNMEYIVAQNNAINMYNLYFSELSVMPKIERADVRVVNIFKEPEFSRPVTSINWSQDGHRFAASYVDVDFDRNETQGLEGFIWNVEFCNMPEVVFSPKSSMLDLQFGKRDENILAGALINGQVCAFDRRIGGNPTVICPPFVAHRDIVKKVLFINSKSGAEFFSGSVDGSCKWWDIRNMQEPTDEMIIDFVKTSFDVPSMANSNAINVLEFETTLPTRFMVGTENGLVISGNRKGKTPTEKLTAQFFAQTGPIMALQRNPYFLKNFLTVGDWTLRIWSEDCKESCIMFTKALRHRMNHAVWSPSRVSLILAVQSNGQIACWDFLRKQHEPTLTVQVCPEPLICSQYNDTGHLAACGSTKGKIYLIELSHNLTNCEKNDKNLFAAILERESRRERILEARLREIKLKHRQAVEAGSPKGSSLELAHLNDRDLIDATTEYMNTIKNYSY